VTPGSKYGGLLLGENNLVDERQQGRRYSGEAYSQGMFRIFIEARIQQAVTKCGDPIPCGLLRYISSRYIFGLAQKLSLVVDGIVAG
jgi:hypothetical protein